MYEIWLGGMFVTSVDEAEIPEIRRGVQCYVDYVSKTIIVF